MNLESHQVDSTAVRRFLLGEASEAERSELEERMLLDDEAFEAMRAGEEELFDAAAHDELTPREMERLADLPEAGERFAFAEALRQVTQAEATGETGMMDDSAKVVAFPERRLHRWLAVAAVLAFTLGAAMWWFFIGSSDFSRPTNTSPVAEFVLEPETLRGDGPELRIPSTAERVVLQLLLAEALSDPLAAELLVDGKLVLRREGLTTVPSEWRKPAVKLDLPAIRLESGGGYTLHLFAGGDRTTVLARYSFEVARTE